MLSHVKYIYYYIKTPITINQIFIFIFTRAIYMYFPPVATVTLEAYSDNSLM